MANNSKAQVESVNTLEIDSTSIGHNSAFTYSPKSAEWNDEQFAESVKRLAQIKSDNRAARKEMTAREMNVEMKLLASAIARMVNQRKADRLVTIIKGKPSALVKTIINKTVMNGNYIAATERFIFEAWEGDLPAHAVQVGAAVFDRTALHLLEGVAAHEVETTDPRNDAFKEFFKVKKSESEKAKAVIKSLTKLAKDNGLSEADLLALARKAFTDSKA